MTTRQLLKRRMTRGLLWFIVLMVAAGILQKSVTWESTEELAIRAIALLGFGVIVWSLTRTPCLQCQSPLGVNALRWLRGHEHYSPRCLHCDLSIDRDGPEPR